jgi:hypothetical protein
MSRYNPYSFVGDSQSVREKDGTPNRQPATKSGSSSSSFSHPKSSPTTPSSSSKPLSGSSYTKTNEYNSLYTAGGSIRKHPPLNGESQTSSSSHLKSDNAGFKSEKKGNPIRPPGSSTARPNSRTTTPPPPTKTYAHRRIGEAAHSLSASEYPAKSSSSKLFSVGSVSRSKRKTSLSDSSDEDLIKNPAELLKEQPTKKVPPAGKLSSLHGDTMGPRKETRSVTQDTLKASVPTISTSSFLGGNPYSNHSTSTARGGVSVLSKPALNTYTKSAKLHVISDDDEQFQPVVPGRETSYTKGLQAPANPPWSVHLFTMILDKIAHEATDGLEVLEQLGKDFRDERWTERRKGRRKEAIKAW